MLKKNFLDNKKRILYKRFEEKAIILNSITRSRKIRSPIRWYCNVVYNKKRRKSSKVEIKNRCVLSGRSRSIYRFARLSRLFLRENDYIGKVPGLTKSYLVMLNNSLNFMFSVIKQASMCGQSGVNFPTSKKCLRVLSVLYRSGFIRGFRYDEKVTRVFLKYSTTSYKPVLKNISGISSNGRPFYISVKSLSKLAHASETFLISTTYGILTTSQALEKNVGGVLLCKIF